MFNESKPLLVVYKEKSYSVWGSFFLCAYTFMHEVVPRVVAIAVSTVMTICRIFCQSSLFMFVDFWSVFIFHPPMTLTCADKFKAITCVNRVVSG